MQGAHLPRTPAECTGQVVLLHVEAHPAQPKPRVGLLHRSFLGNMPLLGARLLVLLVLLRAAGAGRRLLPPIIRPRPLPSSAAAGVLLPRHCSSCCILDRVRLLPQLQLQLAHLRLQNRHASGPSSGGTGPAAAGRGCRAGARLLPPPASPGVLLRQDAGD